MVLKFISLIFGVLIIIMNLFSAIRTFVLPRAEKDPITRFVFFIIHKAFSALTWFFPTYRQKDRIMAFYAPVALLAMPPTWLILISFGYTLIYYYLGAESLAAAFTISGSSLLTLGFARSESTFPILEFSQATIGPLLIALLISYLPTMYSAFHSREMSVNRLSVRAGIPPSPVRMLMRFHRLNRLPELTSFWEDWELWFAKLEESHTSLAALVYFRSPQAEESWVNAAGTILDAAALRLSTLDLPNDLKGPRLPDGSEIPGDAQAAITIRAGFIALRRIADIFRVSHNPHPSYPHDPISIERKTFDQACYLMEQQGLSLKADREKAWQDFAGWRVNYDSVLVALKNLTMAPDAPWISKPD